MFLRKGNPDKAIQDFNIAIGMPQNGIPASQAPILFRGYVYQDKGNCKQAVDDFASFENAYSDSLLALDGLCNCFTKLGNITKAKAVCDALERSVQSDMENAYQ